MKRSSFITWDQLKVGAVIVVAIIVVGVAIYKLGQTANLFSKRYRLTAFLKEANGLREGGPVMVAGQLAGTIRSIEFLAVDNDTTRNLRVILEIDAGLREQIRSDSRARVRTMGLLGDKMIDITPGTPRYGILAANDTIVVAPSVDFEAVLAMAAGATDDVVGLTQDLRQITARLVSGEGTVGQLLTNPRMYDEMAGTLARTNALLVRVQQSNGTVGRMLDDPALYNRLVGAVTSADSMIIALNNRNGTLGRLINDDSLYVNVLAMTGSLKTTATSADSIMKQLAAGQGTMGRMLTDQALYDALNKLVHDISSLLEDVRKDPRRYTRGIVKIF